MEQGEIVASFQKK